MRYTGFFALLFLLPFTAAAKDVTRTYTFPDKAYSVTFPCIGKLDSEQSKEDTYELFRANMICDDRKQTYAIQYFKFYRIAGIKKASLEDKRYFLSEFKDMVRKLYMGDYDKFLTEDEKSTMLGDLPALQFNLVSDEKDNENLKIAALAALDQNNALYLSSIFVKDKENIYNIKEFFDSLKKGSSEGSK